MVATSLLASLKLVTSALLTVFPERCKLMGSTGLDYRCPLCGATRGGGYARDEVGYPLGPCCVDRVIDGESPCLIKSKQLEGIAVLLPNIASDFARIPADAQSPLNLAIILEMPGIRMNVASLLLPAPDFTVDFARFGLNLDPLILPRAAS